MPSELFGIGSWGFSVEVRAEGWLGRWLRFTGTVKDLRAPILSLEWSELQALYQIEADEEEEAKRNQELAGGFL